MRRQILERLVSAAVLAGVASISFGTAAMADGEVNVYSYRQPYLVNPLFEGFTKETGVKVNVIFAKKGLIERMATEGKKSPADVLLTVDIGRLTGAKAKGVTQALSSTPRKPIWPNRAAPQPKGHIPSKPDHQADEQNQKSAWK